MNTPVPTISAQADPRALLTGFDSGSRPNVRQAAEGFETVFLNTMLQSMFTGLEEGGTWGSGQGADAWQGFMIDEYAKSITEAGGIGIADVVERELLALQEGKK